MESPYSIWAWLSDETNRDIVSLLVSIAVAASAGIAWVIVRLHRSQEHESDSVDYEQDSVFLAQKTRCRKPSKANLAALVSRFHPSRTPKLSTKFLLNELGVVRNHHLTRLGILLVGDHPQSFLPSAMVHFVRFEGASKAADTAANEQVRGTIVMQLDALERLLEASINKIQKAETNQLTAKYSRDYKMSILREVLLNAVCHRDYGDLKRTIAVHAFSNRIEVLSPGNWGIGERILAEHEVVSIAELDSRSVSRNPGLANVLYCLGYVEKTGTGIEKIVVQTKKHNMPLPTVEYKDGFLVVTVYPRRKIERRDYSLEAGTRLQAGVDTPVTSLRNQRVNHEKTAARLDPIRELTQLLARDNWDGDILASLLENLVAAGHRVSELNEVLYSHVTSSSSARDVGYVLFGARRAGLALDSGSVFDRWGQLRSSRRPELQMCRIPPFQDEIRLLMGSTDDERNAEALPRHWVIITPFEISETPITQKQYSYFDPARSSSDPALPVIDITWWEAWLFCHWMGGTLPSEAQWEAACRAGTSTAWWSGSSETDLREVAWAEDDEELYAMPVKLKPANPWGLYDMHGNVWEWCLDHYGEYSTKHETDPVRVTDNRHRVLRGGSITQGPELATSSIRRPQKPGLGGLLTSFRLVRSVQMNDDLNHDSR